MYCIYLQKLKVLIHTLSKVQEALFERQPFVLVGGFDTHKFFNLLYVGLRHPEYVGAKTIVWQVSHLLLCHHSHLNSSACRLSRSLITTFQCSGR
jgi:hypothetical protein